MKKNGKEKPCPNCGKINYRAKWQIKKGCNYYCNHKCYGEQKIKLDKDKFNSKEYQKNYYYKNHKKKKEYHRKKQKEKYIKKGQPKERPWIQLNKHPNWKGGKSFEPYSVDWTLTLKKSIRERDHYLCQICNAPQTDIVFHIHHIDNNKKNCNPKNLITLCPNCHSKIHKKNNLKIKNIE